MPVGRRTYLFSGRVQGVGFRQTTYAIARHRAVSGYVRNLPDGRVELVLEGDVGEIDAVVERLGDQMDGHISRIVREDAPATGEFEGFAVRHG